MAAGYADIGDSDRVAHLDGALVAAAVERIHVQLEDAIDQVKSSRGAVPVVLVGGGAVLVNRDIKGASEVMRPEYSGIANAIGAGLAQVGGEVDRIYSYSDLGRDAAMDRAKQEAVERAVQAGAARDTTQIMSLEEVPLTYLPGGAVRLKVKAIGDLARGGAT